MLVAASPAVAQDEEPICADRPGLSTPTCTVPAGMIQVETTIADWIKDRSGGVRTEELTVGETAFKYGVTDRLHIELSLVPYTRVRTRDGDERETLSGFGDMGIAAKYKVTGDDAPVQLALYPFVKIPTAKRPVGNGEIEGGILIPIGYAIPGSNLSLVLGPELALVADEDGSGHHLAMAQVVGIGFPLAPRLSASAEILGSWDWDPAGTVRQYTAGMSAAYLLSNDVQIDAGVNLGLNRATSDVEIYSGVAFRF
jgi:hypothetical protein